MLLRLPGIRAITFNLDAQTLDHKGENAKITSAFEAFVAEEDGPSPRHCTPPLWFLEPCYRLTWIRT